MRKEIRSHFESKKNWLIVSDSNDDQANSFYNKINQVSKSFGITIPSIQDIKFERYNLKTRDKDEIMEFIKEIPNVERMDLVIVILSDRTQDHYKYIKRLLNERLGIPSQIVRSNNFSKDLSYFSNIVLQINVKLGGESYHLNFDNKELTQIVILYIFNFNIADDDCWI